MAVSYYCRSSRYTGSSRPVQVQTHAARRRDCPPRTLREFGGTHSRPQGVAAGSEGP